MEEKDRTRQNASGSVPNCRNLHRNTNDGEEAEDRNGGEMKCSGKSCKSCTAGVIADCVAVCCCPCALVNLLTLALIKVPYMMGRKCLGKRKKKKEKLEASLSVEVVREREVEREREGMEMEDGEWNEWMEKEDKVWSELYEISHLGFGRLSFNDNHSSSDNKDN